MIRPSLLARLLLSLSWKLEFDRKSLRTSISKPLDYKTIESVEVRRGFFWNTIQLTAGRHSIVLRGVQKNGSWELCAFLKKMHRIMGALSSSRKLFDETHFVPNREVREFLGFLKKDGLDRAAMTKSSSWLKPHLSSEDESFVLADFERVLKLLESDFSEIKMANDHFVAQELVREASYFKSVESSPLSEEQQVAVVTFEDSNLLIAAAGSGKSSTVVAKIGYAIKKRLAAPDAILALAFGKDASKELEERIKERITDFIGISSSVKVSTFHALGKNIIAEATRNKPRLCPWAEEEAQEGGLVAALTKGLLEDVGFQNDFAEFVAYWGRPFEHELQWMKRTGTNGAAVPNHEIYESSLSKARSANLEGGPRRLPTMQGEMVRSEQELAIANWLFMHGINYEYEKPFTRVTTTRERRQYLPDFYITDIDCWYEHFALDVAGMPPIKFGDAYLDGVKWKRALHKRCNTRYFETTHHQFISGTVFDFIEKTLTTYGLIPKLLAWSEIEKKLNNEINSAHGLLKTAIKHFKSNDLTFEAVADRAEKVYVPSRAKSFMRVFMAVYTAYKARLESERCIDFEDMIQQAKEYVRQGLYRHPYKLILVDEFQDISTGRAELVRSLLQQQPEARLFAVGDDWQSIYRFAGSDISVMTSFEDHFGFTATNYLKKTYRSNQGIATLAAALIQRNPAQLPKEVHAQNQTKCGAIELLPYTEDKKCIEDIEDILDALANGISVGSKKSVYFLGRYRHLKPNFLSKWKAKFKDKLDISYYTIHRAKGRQADVVFILDVSGDDGYGFPCKREDDPLLELFIPQGESYPFAEERRLLYVALTRAKHKVYICVPVVNPSPFVSEIVDISRDHDCVVLGKVGFEQMRSLVCPGCGKGMLVSRSGQYGPFLGCSTFPQCTYTAKSQ